MSEVKRAKQWRETGHLTEKERASAGIAGDRHTDFQGTQAPNTVYAQAAGLFSKEEIAAVEWLAIAINAGNRIAISSRYLAET